MGVAPFNIASSVLLIMAQRLARRLCVHCKAKVDLPRAALREEGFTDADIEEGLTIYGPVGCEHCNKGYRGRVGIFQVMPISEAITRLILEGGNSMQLADQARREGDLRSPPIRAAQGQGRDDQPGRDQPGHEGIIHQGAHHHGTRSSKQGQTEG